MSLVPVASSGSRLCSDFFGDDVRDVRGIWIGESLFESEDENSWRWSLDVDRRISETVLVV